MKIGLDIDEVVYPLTSVLLPALNKDFGTDLSLDDLTEYAIFREYGIDLRQYLRKNDSVLYSAKASPFTVKVVNDLKKDGHEITYITAREADTLPYILDWLDRNCLPVKNLVCTPDKGKYADVFGLDLFVDDHVAHLYDIRNAGVDTLLMDQPWNRGNSDFHRVYGMADVKKYINEVTDDRK